MEQLQAETVFRKRWKVSHDLEEDGQVAFFDEEQSELVVVNAIGAAVWELLDGERTLAQIASELAGVVPDAPSYGAVLAEVQKFVAELYERQAVEPVG